MRREILLMVSLILCAATAWGAENNTTMAGEAEDPVISALKDVIMKSSVDFTSYRFTLDMDQTMKLINLSNQTEPSQVIMVKSFGAGSLNLTDKSMKVALANVINPFGDDDNVTAMAVEEYLINDTIYMKIEGNWTSLKLAMPDIWTQQDMAGKQMELFNQSKISLLAVEAVDGQDCYKIGVAQDMEAFSKVASEQADLSLGMIDLTKLYQNATMDMTYWIAMDSKQLKKMEMTMDMSLNPLDLGLPPEEMDNVEMQMSIKSTYLYRDINENVNIVLPPEAATAQPLNLPLLDKEEKPEMEKKQEMEVGTEIEEMPEMEDKPEMQEGTVVEEMPELEELPEMPAGNSSSEEQA